MTIYFAALTMLWAIAFVAVIIISDNKVLRYLAIAMLLINGIVLGSLLAQLLK